MCSSAAPSAPWCVSVRPRRFWPRNRHAPLARYTVRDYNTINARGRGGGEPIIIGVWRWKKKKDVNQRADRTHWVLFSAVPSKRSYSLSENMSGAAPGGGGGDGVGGGPLSFPAQLENKRVLSQIRYICNVLNYLLGTYAKVNHPEITLPRIKDRERAGVCKKNFFFSFNSPVSTIRATEKNRCPLIHTPQLSLRPGHLGRSTFRTILPDPRCLRILRRHHLHIRRQFCSKSRRKIIDDYCCWLWKHCV